MPTESQDRPSTPRKEYVDAAPDITLIRDLMGGTRRMHSQFKEYIPKYKAEKPESYKRRATGAKVYGGLGRTLSASVGMLFAKPPTREGTWTPEMTDHAESIDGKGTKLEVFLKRGSEDAVADGFVGTLVDFPPVEGQIVHSKDEQELGARPKWVKYNRADILSWDTTTINNAEVLSQVVLREGATKKVGRFRVEHITLYRVCVLVFRKDTTDSQEPQWLAMWELIEEKQQQDGSVMLVSHGSGQWRDKNGTPFDRIPLAISYAGRTDAILTAHPPLLDVAWANLEHWRVATNLRAYEDQCCFPQPTVKGELAKGKNGEPLPFMGGPGVLVQTTKDSEFTFTELAGTSLDQLRQSLKEKKDEIGELGMSFLGSQPNGVESAEKARLDSTAENSTLATAAQGIEDGYNLALQFHAQYQGIERQNAPTVKVNREFEDQTMDPAVMGAYAALIGTGMPKEEAVTMLIQGGRLPADTNVMDFVRRWDEAEEAKADMEAMRRDVQVERMKDKAA